MTRVLLAALLATAAMTTVAGATADPGGRDPRPRSQCPRHAQKLPATGIRSAKRAALAWTHRRYGSDAEGAYVQKALRATKDSPRGGYALSVCRSKRIQSRTVDVYIRLPKLLPSESASSVIVAVAKTAGRYRVWTQLH
jgi:hypothetical protein